MKKNVQLTASAATVIALAAVFTKFVIGGGICPMVKTVISNLLPGVHISIAF